MTIDVGKLKYTFFWTGPFSQWYISPFKVAGIEFNCAEQFMMYSKALLFCDYSTAGEVLNTKIPHEQKELGRKVRNFNDDFWQLFREGIVFTGSYAKFTQNEELKAVLLNTGNTLLVEASPDDRIWGIGLSKDDARRLNPKLWKGQNLLGNILTQVRGAISEINFVSNIVY